jgi:hypothetical protein
MYACLTEAACRSKACSSNPYNLNHNSCCNLQCANAVAIRGHQRCHDVEHKAEILRHHEEVLTEPAGKETT